MERRNASSEAFSKGMDDTVDKCLSNSINTSARTDCTEELQTQPILHLNMRRGAEELRILSNVYNILRQFLKNVGQNSSEFYRIKKRHACYGSG